MISAKTAPVINAKFLAVSLVLIGEMKYSHLTNTVI